MLTLVLCAGLCLALVAVLHLAVILPARIARLITAERIAALRVQPARGASRRADLHGRGRGRRRRPQDGGARALALRRDLVRRREDAAARERKGRAEGSAMMGRARA